MKTNKICCIFNYPPHYRDKIYRLIDRELNCDFYFGDEVETPIKKMSFDNFKGETNVLKNLKILNSSFVWQKGILRPIFKPYNFYIITGLPNYLSYWLLLLFSKLTRKKVYAWSHGIKGDPFVKGRNFEKMFYKLCDGVLLYGETARKNMLQLGYKKEKLFCIYNSLEYDNQLKIRMTLEPTNLFKKHFNNSYPVLIYVGRLQRIKKLDLLVNAVYELNKSKTKVNLVLVGKNVDAEKSLFKLCEKYGIIENVWFYGPCYDENKLAELFYNSYACVSPGPVGLTAIHSLSFGTPVITNDDFNTQMPEYEAIQDGITGSFYQSEDERHLLDEIIKWVSVSEEKRKSIREKAFQTIDEKYNPYYQINLLKKILRK